MMGGLNINQELFCRYYTQNTEIFGNATVAYAEAYDYRLDELPDDDAVYAVRTGDDGKPERVLVEPSTRAKARNVCGVEGHRLLKNPKVLERITALLNEMLTEEVVDAELLKVILQNHDLGPKVRAIQEFNKVRQRVTQKVDLTSGGMSFADLMRLADEDEDAAEPEGGQAA
jgi:hypothetical protein